MYLKPLLILIAIFFRKDKKLDLNKNNYLNHLKIIPKSNKNNQKQKLNRIFYILFNKKNTHYLNLKSNRINLKNSSFKEK